MSRNMNTGVGMDLRPMGRTCVRFRVKLSHGSRPPPSVAGVDHVQRAEDRARRTRGPRDAARAPDPRRRPDPLDRRPDDGRPRHRAIVDPRGGRGHLGVAGAAVPHGLDPGVRRPPLVAWPRRPRPDAGALRHALPCRPRLSWGAGMADLDWDHDGAAQVVAVIGQAADTLASPAAGLGAGAPASVGADVEGMLDDLGQTWQRDLNRRWAAVTAVRDALAAQDRAVRGTDRAVTI